MVPALFWGNPMTDILSGADRWGARRNRLFVLLQDRGLRGFAAEITRRGLRECLAIAVRRVRYGLSIALGRRWDRKYGVETGGQIELDALDVLGPNRELGAPAVSVSPRTFAFLSQFLLVNPLDTVFVDLGAGKGRALCLASLMGFERVIGVEFSKILCEKAQDNVASFLEHQPRHGTFTIVHADATTYALPGSDLVLYFGNPFALELWPKMIENIVASLQDTPRNISVVVAGSQLETIRGAGALLASSGRFARIASGRAPYYLDTYLPYHYECFASRAYFSED
jgi:hypothetical protein